MITLVDTSTWVDHLRRGNPALTALLQAYDVLCHPFIIGELACGRLENRYEILTLLQELPQAPMAAHEEALEFLSLRRLMGRGIGWIDMHLLASAMLARARLCTLDRRLRETAVELGLAET